jgi:large subunit ribosomal protein L3
MAENNAVTPTDGGAAVATPAPSLKAILAEKVGMTRVYDDQGRFIPVTVLAAADCRVIQVKTTATDGYASLQLGLGTAKEKNLTAPVAGHYRKSGQSPARWLGEVRVPAVDGFAAGQRVAVDQFAAGDVVDATGISKGKGYAGAVKRHRFKGGPKTHGQSDRWRAPGSSGRERVWPGKRGPGHMGVDRITVQRLEVVKVDAEQNLLLIKGSVPGPMGTCVTIRRTVRPRRVKKVAVSAAKKSAKPAGKDKK